jgi:ATP-dependent DNA ligase
MALQRENRRLSVSKRPSPFIEPALATAINKVPSSERWFHEVKFDGYRVQLHLANETVRVFTRRFPDFLGALSEALLVGPCQCEGLLFQFFRQCRNASAPTLAVAAPKL